MSYYKTIDGVKYDRELLEAAEAAVAGVNDHVVSTAEATNLVKELVDAGRITIIERRTIEYILSNFKFTAKARTVVEDVLAANPDLTITEGPDSPEDHFDRLYDEGIAIIRRNMYWSGGIGLLPFPLLDTAAVATVQYRMARQLSHLYGYEMRHSRIKTIVIAITGGLFTNIFAQGTRGLLRAIPLVGPVLGATSFAIWAAASTWAIGRVFLYHYASGGSPTNLDVRKARHFFRHEYEAKMEELQSTASAS